MDEPVYLDNASTTRLDPAVFEAMRPYLDGEYGNPASKYYELGRRASEAVEQARAAVAKLVGARAPEEIYFTSGATEANNWILHGRLAWNGPKHAVTGAVEHHAILEPLEFLKKNAGLAYDVVGVDAMGHIDQDAFRAALRPETSLVTVMMANNEIGTIEDIAALGRVLEAEGRRGEVLLHTDAVQAVGKIPVDATGLGVDALSISAHKFHGPKGVGALYLRKGARCPSYQHGGNQERDKRAGTLNVAGIVGMGKAAELALARVGDGAEAARQRAWTEKLWAELSARVPKIRRNGDPGRRLPNMLSICVEGAEGEAILGYLDMLHGIQVSSGSACTSGSLEPSHVLLALGVPVEIAHGSIRFSASHLTPDSEVMRVSEAVAGVIERVRSMSVTWS